MSENKNFYCVYDYEEEMPNKEISGIKIIRKQTSDKIISLKRDMKQIAILEND